MGDRQVLGLLLYQDAECDLLRRAAEACDLETTDQITHPFPPVIVTDQTSGPWVRSPYTIFSRAEAPLLIFVADPATPTDPSNYLCVLNRPLHLEAVTAALQQAISAIRFFTARQASLLADLHHCRKIVDSVSNGITISDANLPGLPLTYVNPAFERMTGYPADEVNGRNCRFLQGNDLNQPEVAILRASLRDGTDARAVLRNYRKDGSLFWNELYLSPIRDSNGLITHFVGIQNDVTAQVKINQQLEHRAHHDILTGLGNRGLLMVQLRQALEKARRSNGGLAVLYFDLDNFKHVNDTFGHDAGDTLLITIADRLRSGARAGETVARIGGDEFIVVLEDFTPERQAQDVLKRLSATLCESVTIHGIELHPSASIGMALYPQDGQTAEELLKAADFKMYLVKHDVHSESENAAAVPEVAP
jgi:diguanylate cyclase (GGDEF)-like protein/PAS domain S-box-containing protein